MDLRDYLHTPALGELMKTNIFIKIFIIINLIFVGGVSYAQEANQGANAQSQHLRVGIYHNYPIVYESDGLATGFHLELLKEVAKQEGWILDYKFMGSPSNVIQGLENGNLDIGMGLVPTPERQQFLEFTKEKNATLRGRIIVKSADEGISSTRNLRGKNIAVIRQDILGKNGLEIFEQLGISANFTWVRSNDELLKAILTNAVDAGICNQWQGEKYAKLYGIHQTSIVFDPKEVHYAVPKDGRRYIIDTLDQHLRTWKMRPGSIYYGMKNEFLPDQSADQAKYTNRELLTALGVILLFILFGILLGNFMAAESETHLGRISTSQIKQIIIFTLTLSISFWVMDSYIQWLLFNDDQDLGLIELALTNVPPEHLYIRATFFLVCCFCGLFLARYISKYEKLLNIVLAGVNRFEQLTDNAQDMIFRMTLPDGEYEYVSKASANIFGYSPEEFYKRPLLIVSLLHPDWEKYFQTQWENLLIGNLPRFYEFQIINKAGEVRWVNQRSTLYFDESGVPSALEGIITDVTEQKTAGPLTPEG